MTENVTHRPPITTPWAETGGPHHGPSLAGLTPPHHTRRLRTLAYVVNEDWPVGSALSPEVTPAPVYHYERGGAAPRAYDGDEVPTRQPAVQGSWPAIGCACKRLRAV